MIIDDSSGEYTVICVQVLNHQNAVVSDGA